MFKTSVDGFANLMINHITLVDRFALLCDDQKSIEALIDFVVQFYACHSTPWLLLVSTSAKGK